MVTNKSTVIKDKFSWIIKKEKKYYKIIVQHRTTESVFLYWKKWHWQNYFLRFCIFYLQRNTLTIVEIFVVSLLEFRSTLNTFLMDKDEQKFCCVLPYWTHALLDSLLVCCMTNYIILIMQRKENRLAFCPWNSVMYDSRQYWKPGFHISSNFPVEFQISVENFRLLWWTYSFKRSFKSILDCGPVWRTSIP